jgi:hypothetical protein
MIRFIKKRWTDWYAVNWTWIDSLSKNHIYNYKIQNRILLKLSLILYYLLYNDS